MTLKTIRFVSRIKSFLATLGALAVMPALSAADLTTYTWVGGSSGNYEDVANWDPQPSAAPTGATVELLFTNKADVVCTVSGRQCGQITVRGGNVAIKTSTGSMRFYGSSATVFDVATGYTLSFTSFTTVSFTNLKKIGGGTVSCDCSFGESDLNGPKTIEVAEGVLWCKARYGKLYVKDTITVRSGAELRGYLLDKTPDQIRPYTKLVIEEGGLLDYRGLPGTFGPLSGGGTVKGLGSADSPVVLVTTGEGGFTGTLAGYVKFAPTNDVPFVVSNPDALLNATVSFGEMPAGAKPLAFAPGVAYNVKDPSAFAGVDRDTDGNPVVLCKTVASGSTYTHQTAGDDTWSANWLLNGTGDVIEKSGGTWTIGNFAKTGGKFTLHKDTTGTNLVFAGGTSTNVNAGEFTLRAFGTPYRVDFTGGDHHFSSYLTGEANLTYRQTAGTVWAYPLLATFSSGSQVCSSNDIFYTMTGGTLISKPDVRTSYGLGLEVGGTAKAYLYDGSKGAHKVSHLRDSIIRVKDSGYVYADNLDFVHYGTANNTGTLDLRGGRMEVANRLGFQHAGAIGTGKGRVAFNGGTLSLGANIAVVPMASAFADDVFRTSVGPNGGTLVVNRVNDTPVKWYGPIDVAAADGGFVKAGLGGLAFDHAAALTGTLTLKAGWLQTQVASPTTPFGTGSVRIESGVLSTISAKGGFSVATGDGAAIEYADNANVEIGVNKLTAGGLRRTNHGVLFVRRAADDGKMGDRRFVVTAGVANDATTGLAAQPVYVYTPLVYGNGYGTRAGGMIGFLTYDGANGFTNATTTVGLPDGTTSASVCEVSGGHVDLTHDASVGALSVWAPATKTSTGNLTIGKGCTLTLGNGEGTIAPLILNNTGIICTQNEGSGSCKVSGGTIDFGSAEAQILVNVGYRNFTRHESAYLSSRLTGSGDLVVAAPWSDGSRYFVRAVDITGDNALTGDTWIKGVAVRIKEPTGLGSGTVTVDGNAWFGGRLTFRSDYTGTSFASPIILSGVGPVALSSDYSGETSGATCLPPDDGALSVLKSVQLTGGLTLAGDAIVQVGGGAVADVASTVAGAGRLELKGNGVLRLSAANTFTGGILVRTGATLEIAGVGTVGTGTLTLEKGAVLRFADRATVPSGFTWEGEGSVEFGAAPTGDESLVKTGDGELILRARGDYTGETRVEEGTLCLGYPTPAALPYPDQVSFRFDAGDATTLTYDATTKAVSAWAEADGRTGTFAQGYATRRPQYDAAAFGGRGAVFFPGTAAQQLTNGTAKSFQTLFAVAQVGDETGAHPLNGKGVGSWDYAPLIGHYGVGMNDLMIRMPTWFAGMNPYWAAESLAAGAEFGINGVATNGFAFGEETVVSVALASRATRMPLAMGECYGWSDYNYSLYGSIGEIVAYTGYLGEEDRRKVEQYLMAKWGLAPAKPTVENMLPATTDLTVADGAKLDLAGTFQQVATMDLSGEIVNSSATLAVLRLESGTSTVTGGSFGENIELQVREGAVLDLGGGTLTVDWVKCLGSQANIVNGTLVVRKGYRRPYGLGLSVIVR